MAQAVQKAAEKSKELLKDGYKAVSSAFDSIKRKSFYDQFHVFVKNEVNQNDSKIRERCAKLAEDLVLNNKEEFIAICIEKKIQKQQERERIDDVDMIYDDNPQLEVALLDSSKLASENEIESNNIVMQEPLSYKQGK